MRIDLVKLSRAWAVPICMWQRKIAAARTLSGVPYLGRLVRIFEQGTPISMASSPPATRTRTHPHPHAHAPAPAHAHPHTHTQNARKTRKTHAKHTQHTHTQHTQHTHNTHTHNTHTHNTHTHTRTHTHTHAHTHIHNTHAHTHTNRKTRHHTRTHITRHTRHTPPHHTPHTRHAHTPARARAHTHPHSHTHPHTRTHTHTRTHAHTHTCTNNVTSHFAKGSTSPIGPVQLDQRAQAWTCIIDFVALQAFMGEGVCFVFSDRPTSREQLCFATSLGFRRHKLPSLPLGPSGEGCRAGTTIRAKAGSG